MFIRLSNEVIDSQLGAVMAMTGTWGTTHLEPLIGSLSRAGINTDVLKKSFDDTSMAIAGLDAEASGATWADLLIGGIKAVQKAAQDFLDSLKPAKMGPSGWGVRAPQKMSIDPIKIIVSQDRGMGEAFTASHILW
jgi:hypothetical protein